MIGSVNLGINGSLTFNATPPAATGPWLRSAQLATAKLALKTRWRQQRTSLLVRRLDPILHHVEGHNDFQL